ncbi:unnamed protein product [Clonostachys rhizophaga]|uniref:C2H2-type domain-containing protein n=1 Tax=Clonostachys rhizophaga TaxID=160324 RepID=A0A9N9VZJ8_9HYPO|nr:unnamed protein product [Clonostachys rhizophaga]
MSIASASTNVAEPKRPPFQPFQCHICHSRFTRHENLKRHAALHNRSPSNASLPCEFCSATFSRPDLRHRHMKKKHAEFEDTRPRKRRQSPRQAPSPPAQAILQAEKSRVASQGSEGSEEDDAQFLTDILAQQPQPSTATSESPSIGHLIAADLGPSPLMGTSLLDPSGGFDVQMHPMDIPHSTTSFATDLSCFNFDQATPEEGFFPMSLPHLQDDWFPSNNQITRGCDLFFTHVSPFVPFLHQPSFDPSQSANHLVLSILCLAYQYGEDPDCGDQSGTGQSLSSRTFHRARALVASDEEGVEDSTLAQHVAMVQAYFLLELYSMMYLCGKKDSLYGLKTHSKIISLARSSGMAQPTFTNASEATEDLDSLWHEFIRAESHKRTIFAVHQLDTLWYQFLSIPRLFSHLEIKHELPCPEDYWAAPTSVQWAHRQLVNKNTGSSVPYPDAIRRFLSPEGDPASIPAFDSYGAINITHFLVSSAREISGWSTMTGMLSMERLEPLRTSLLALSPFIHSHPEASNPSHLGEATWEAAMIELQMWSPSHTGGIVEGSMDAVMHQFTFLPSSCEFLCEADTAKTIQPHVNWFLQYLDMEPVPDAEAPWIILYSYKAFMIAWQLVRGGVADAMKIVNVQDGDSEGALAWAREAFGRRQRWQLGKIALACLDTLTA